MKWFNNPETLEDLKKQYKKLAFQNHPDRDGKSHGVNKVQLNRRGRAKSPSSFFYFMVSKFAFLSVIKVESQNNGGMTHDNEN